MAKLLLSLKKYRQQPAFVRTPSAVSILILLGLLAIVLVVPDTTDVQPAHAAQLTLEQGSPNKPISLRDRLVAGLKARRKVEIEFVESVVNKVNQGQLPQRLVDQTFFWARDRANIRSVQGRVRRPIIYFQPAMIARAKRLRVTI